jgi:hypothetical protein
MKPWKKKSEAMLRQMKAGRTTKQAKSHTPTKSLARNAN